LAGLMVLLGLTVYGLLRIRLGLDLTDEGFYLSAPLRYALGDLPFRDEISNPLRMFDILLWPIFSAFPSITLYQARLLGLGLHLAGLTATVFLLRRYAPVYFVALAGGAAAFSYEWLWAPSYNLMGPAFITLGACVWLAAWRIHRGSASLILGILSGLAFSAGFLSFFPFLAVLPVFLVVMGKELRKKAPPVEPLRSTALVGGTIVLVGLIGGLVLYFTGLIEYWLESLSLLVSSQQAVKPFSERIPEFLLQLLFCFPLSGIMGAVITAAGLLLLGRPIAPRPARIVIVNTIAACLLVVIMLNYPASGPRWEQFPSSHLIFSAGLAFHCTALFLWVRFRDAFLVDSEKSREWIFVWAVLFWVSAITGLIHALSSTNGFINIFYSMTLWTALGAAGLYYSMTTYGVMKGMSKLKAERITAGLLLAVITPFTFLGLVSGYQEVYRDQPPHQLIAKFNAPKLHGIISTPDRVTAVEDLLNFLSTKLNRGDILLAYDSIPLLYFLTDTRPALNHTWTYKNWDALQRQEAIKIMSQRGRIPRYCVQCLIHPELIGRESFDNTAFYSVDPEIDPLHAFVRANYNPIALFYPFQVWQHKRYARSASLKSQPTSVIVDPSRWLGPDTSQGTPFTQIRGDTGRFELFLSPDQNGAGLSVHLNETAKKELAEAPPGNKPVFIILLEAQLDPNQTAGKPILLEAPIHFRGIGTCTLRVEDYLGQARARHEVKVISYRRAMTSLDTMVRPKATAVKVGVEFRPASPNDYLELGEMRIQVE